MCEEGYVCGKIQAFLFPTSVSQLIYLQSLQRGGGDTAFPKFLQLLVATV